MVFLSYIRIEPNHHKYFGSSSKSEMKREIYSGYFTSLSSSVSEQAIPMGRDGDVRYVHMWPTDPFVLS